MSGIENLGIGKRPNLEMLGQKRRREEQHGAECAKARRKIQEPTEQPTCDVQWGEWLLCQMGHLRKSCAEHDLDNANKNK